MNRRILVASMAMSVSLFAAQALQAAPLPIAHLLPVHAKMGKIKTVKFNLRNDSSTALKVKAGDNEMTLDPGKTTEVKLPEGQQVVAVDGSTTVPAGTVVATASAQLEGNTVAIR